jgi:hypothetical protein
MDPAENTCMQCSAHGDDGMIGWTTDRISDVTWTDTGRNGAMIARWTLNVTILQQQSSKTSVPVCVEPDWII